MDASIYRLFNGTLFVAYSTIPPHWITDITCFVFKNTVYLKAIGKESDGTPFEFSLHYAALNDNLILSLIFDNTIHETVIIWTSLRYEDWLCSNDDDELLRR